MGGKGAGASDVILRSDNTLPWVPCHHVYKRKEDFPLFGENVKAQRRLLELTGPSHQSKQGRKRLPL